MLAYLLEIDFAMLSLTTTDLSCVPRTWPPLYGILHGARVTKEIKGIPPAKMQLGKKIQFTARPVNIGSRLATDELSNCKIHPNIIPSYPKLRKSPEFTTLLPLNDHGHARLEVFNSSVKRT